MAEAKIQVLSGPEAGREVVFRDSLILGRSRAAGLVLHHPTVSREHARIFFREGRWNLVDLKSRNGTRLRGKPVTKAELREGDEILLGEVRLRFLSAGEPGSEGSPEGAQDAAAPPREEPLPPGEGSPQGGREGKAPSLEVEEIRLEEAEPGPAPSRAAPAPPSPSLSRGPAGGPRPAGPAGPGARRLGGDPAALAGKRNRSGGSLLEEDLSQWSGFARFLAVLLGLLLAAALFYLAFTLVS